MARLVDDILAKVVLMCSKNVRGSDVETNIYEVGCDESLLFPAPVIGDGRSSDGASSAAM